MALGGVYNEAKQTTYTVTCVNILFQFAQTCKVKNADRGMQMKQVCDLHADLNVRFFLTIVHFFEFFTNCLFFY